MLSNLILSGRLQIFSDLWIMHIHHFLRKLMVVHKKELNEKQIEFEGVVGSLKKKNAHLSEQRRCLLLGLDLKFPSNENL